MSNQKPASIRISDKRKISDLQEEFTREFPYLKIEFFSRSHKEGAPSPRRLMKTGDQTIGQFRTVHKKGSLSIEPTMTVSELERRFRELYGLNVQLFRKSGKIWLETTVTDSWTLKQQNEQGESLSTLMPAAGYVPNPGSMKR